MGAVFSSVSDDSNKFPSLSIRRGNLRMVQNVLLIWLDRNIDEKNADCRHTIDQLRCVVNTIHKYTSPDDCMKFLETIADEKACLIISGSLGQEIIDRIHKLVQVESIFIFCRNPSYHENWAKNWPKICGVFTDINSICSSLRQTVEQCEHNSTSISFMKTTNVNQLDVSFMYTQIFKEILSTIEFDRQHIRDYLDFCREQFKENASELKNIKQFKAKYTPKTSIWWYSKNCFLYPMLNRALRTMDVDVIIKMGFFIVDLHRQLEKLHGQQNPHDTFVVYRGQGLSTNDFKQMSTTIGGLLAFNNFLSTSKKRHISYDFALNATRNPDLVGVLFVMKIDPTKSTTPFAAINGYSVYPVEDEILFSMHSVFRIENIELIDKTERLYQVDLKLTSDNDQDLCQLTKQMHRETSGPSGWFQLGQLLRKIGEFEQAQQIFINILNRKISDDEKALVYNQLGMIKNIQGEFAEAIRLYERSLDILSTILPSGDIQFSTIYENLGFVYSNKKDYSKAVASQLKALEIRKKVLDYAHPDLAASYNNIGVLYAHIREFKRALEYFIKAHNIQIECLPSNHPGLAQSYDNIGNAYSDMQQYSKALVAHEKALEIFQRSLPTNHPDLAMSLNNIGVAHENLGNYIQAKSFYERAVEIGRISLPSDHSEYKKWLKNLENLRRKF